MNTNTSELDRLLASAKAAQRLADEMLTTKTESDEALEAVARGLVDAGKAAELAVKQKQGKALVDSVMRLGSTENWDDDGNPRGSLFTSEAKAGFATAIKTRSAYRTNIDRKALTVGGLVPSSGTGVVPGAYPNNLTALADLFPNQAADGPVQRYYRFTAGTAAVVAEGAQKPDSGTTVQGIDVPLVKIATTSKVSDELSQDAGFLVGFLQAELTAAVVSAENEQIVASLTASGILTDSGPAADVIDLVGSAIAAQEGVAGLTPTAVIVNPTVLAAIRAQKASTAGTYFVDPWTSGPPTLHGLRLASTPAVAADTVWVASGQAVTIFRRGPVQVETGLDGEDFSFNLRTIRCEERMASAVVRPSGLTKITLT